MYSKSKKTLPTTTLTRLASFIGLQVSLLIGKFLWEWRAIVFTIAISAILGWTLYPRKKVALNIIPEERRTLIAPRRNVIERSAAVAVPVPVAVPVAVVVVVPVPVVPVPVVSEQLFVEIFDA